MALQDLQFFLLARVGNTDREEETIELRLGEVVRPLLFDGILRRDDEEGRRQWVGFLAHGHVAFLHGLEERGLGFRRRSVDLVGQEHVGEDGAPEEAEAAHARRRILLDDVRSGDVRRHEVRRELDALEARRKHTGEGADEERLGEPGHADQDGVPPREERDQEFLHDRVLPHDDLGEFAGDAVARIPEERGLRRIGGRGRSRLDGRGGSAVHEEFIVHESAEDFDVRERSGSRKGNASRSEDRAGSVCRGLRDFPWYARRSSL
jgi:hypothetical protein